MGKSSKYKTWLLSLEKLRVGSMAMADGLVVIKGICGSIILEGKKMKMNMEKFGECIVKYHILFEFFS